MAVSRMVVQYRISTVMTFIASLLNGKGITNDHLLTHETAWGAMNATPQHLIYRGYDGYDGFGGFRQGQTYTLPVATEDRETYVLHPDTDESWGQLPDVEFWKRWEATKKAPK